MTMRIAVTVAPDHAKRLTKLYEDSYGELLFMQQWHVLRVAFEKLIDKVHKIYPVESYTLYPEFQANGAIHAHGVLTVQQDDNDTAWGCFVNIFTNKSYAPSVFGDKKVYCKYSGSWQYVSFKVKRSFGDWSKWTEYMIKSEEEVKKLKVALRPASKNYMVTDEPDPKMVKKAKEDAAYIDLLTTFVPKENKNL